MADARDEARDETPAAQHEVREVPEVRDAESEAELKARKEREKNELYALDISDVEWHSAPGTEEHEERVEIAYLPGGAVAMRSSVDPDTVLRYTEAEWTAFVLGARDGEFDLEPMPHNGGMAAE